MNTQTIVCSQNRYRASPSPTLWMAWMHREHHKVNERNASGKRINRLAVTHAKGPREEWMNICLFENQLEFSSTASDESAQAVVMAYRIQVPPFHVRCMTTKRFSDAQQPTFFRGMANGESTRKMLKCIQQRCIVEEHQKIWEIPT